MLIDVDFIMDELPGKLRIVAFLLLLTAIAVYVYSEEVAGVLDTDPRMATTGDHHHGPPCKSPRCKKVAREEPADGNAGAQGHDHDAPGSDEEAGGGDQ